MRAVAPLLCAGMLVFVGLAVLPARAAIGAPAGLAAEAVKLPVLQNIGIIPLQVEQREGSDRRLASALAHLGEGLPAIVRRSRRFRVLNDDLVGGLWKDAAGRAELVDQFELDALVSLSVAPRGDAVALVVRLSDPKLNTLLTEQETVARSWLAAAVPSAIDDKLEGLLFAMFNRIPVDVSVTSVQGVYITVSGGSEQGVEAGDRVQLVRTRVRSLHPSNGAWHEFETRAVGTAEIVDVKPHNAVARITGQVSENAIAIGDGARIGAIASRLKFSRMAHQDEFKDKGAQGAVILPPLYLGDGGQPASPKAGSKPEVKLAQNGVSAPVDGTINDVPLAPSARPSEEKVPPAVVAEESTEEEGSFFDMLKSPQDKWLDDATVYFGPHWWSVKGPVSASGRFPAWFVNSLGVTTSRTLIHKLKLSVGGGVSFGQSGGTGSHMGYQAHARVYWEDAIDGLDGLITGWRAGGYGSFSGVAVMKEKYGGGDWLRGGGFGGLNGSFRLHPNDPGAPMIEEGRWDWFADFAIMPLNIGRFGYDGKQHPVESSFGTNFVVGAYAYRPPTYVNWGGAFEYSREKLTLKNNKRPVMTEYALKALAKYVF